MARAWAAKGTAAGAVRVRVPATSANLGPGFDSLGLALALHDEVEARICASGLSIEISGDGAGLAAAGEEHLVVRAMRAAFDFAGGQPPGIRLRCVNRIPHGRGLGSSAAAIVGGILAARALAGQPPAGQPTAGQPPAAPGTAGLPDEAAFRLAAGLEGHPDNVAACLGGGLTVAWMSAGHPRMARLDVLAPVTPVVCVAPAAVRTELVRGILPGTVPHRDAAANAGRSALLVAVLTRPPGAGLDTAGALLDATEDWLHQNYRAGVMPETHRLLTRARAAGLPAVVSGAGPSVLVFLPARGSPDYRRHLERLGSIVRKTGTTWRISSLDVERHGARVLRPEPEPGP